MSHLCIFSPVLPKNILLKPLLLPCSSRCKLWRTPVRKGMTWLGRLGTVSGNGEPYSPKQDPEPGHQRWSNSPLLLPNFLFSQFCYRQEYSYTEKQWVLESATVWPETVNQQLISRKKMLDVGFIEGSLLMLFAGCPAMVYKPRGVSPVSSTITTW